MKNYANHYLYNPRQESYTGKYDLKNSVMLKRDPLPSSFVENIISSFQKKNGKEFDFKKVVDKKNEKESIDKKKEIKKKYENKNDENDAAIVNSYPFMEKQRQLLATHQFLCRLISYMNFIHLKKKSSYL